MLSSSSPSRALRAVSAGLRRFGGCRRGNISIMFAFSALPMLMALGAGIDYGLAMKRQARINAAADAAALAAVTPTMMKQSPAIAQAAALAFFDSQVSGMTGTTYSIGNVKVKVTDTAGSSTVTRSATVSYTAGSPTTFSKILQVSSLAIKGTSTASAAVSPNIDFYLMLDTSPSMAIAATTDDIAKMVAATPSQGGCAFACHQTAPGVDGLSQDNYALARSLNVTLRIDMVVAAVKNLMTTASNTAATTGAVYRMAGYDFDYATTNVIPLTSNMTLAQSQASNITLLQVYSNNYLTKTTYNSDQDTNFDQGFSTLNATMPTPGNGTNVAGDSPQEVLFLVTDGVSDTAGSSGRTYVPFGPTSPIVGGVPTATWCTNIKKRGIRIAVLYTTYNPLPTNSWYKTYIAPQQSTIAPAAQACASSGLFFQVDTGGDISAAMSTLFATAVSSAHLTN